MSVRIVCPLVKVAVPAAGAFATCTVQLNELPSAKLPLTLFVFVAVRSGNSTVSVAVAVFPTPPLVELTLPLVLLYVLAEDDVTRTVTVQTLFARIEPLYRTILLPPAAAVSVPPQELVVVKGVALTRPIGYVSLNPTPVSTV